MVAVVPSALYVWTLTVQMDEPDYRYLALDAVGKKLATADGMSEYVVTGYCRSEKLDIECPNHRNVSVTIELTSVGGSGSKFVKVNGHLRGNGLGRGGPRWHWSSTEVIES